MKKIIFLIVISQILIVCIFFYKNVNFNKNTIGKKKIKKRKHRQRKGRKVQI